MRRITLLLLLVVSATVALQAQNIQLHYDFGHSLYDKEMKDRPHLTSTIEKFHPDKWGSSFFFVDMDYTSNGVEQAYWELSRELQFWKAPFSIHLEYNGGLAKKYPIKNAYLTGLTYTYNNATFSRGFSLSGMYKYIQKHDSPNNFQFTATWYMNLCNNLYTFSGFADYWREKSWFGSTMTFMSEPQFWVNLNRVKGVDEKFNLSVGTEVEITNNFYQGRAFVTPTLALKWTLN